MRATRITSRAISIGTTLSLACALSTMMVLPSGVVNFSGTIPQAYRISVSTDLSLSSLFCANAGLATATMMAPAHRSAAPALAPFPIMPSPLSSPLPACSRAAVAAVPPCPAVAHRSVQNEA